MRGGSSPPPAPTAARTGVVVAGGAAVAFAPWAAKTFVRSGSRFPTRCSTISVTVWRDTLARSDPGFGLGLRHRPRVPPGSLRDWRTTFNWRAQEDRFNRWPHFLTEIDGQQIHFIHARSDNPDALPLILSHGWPGSVAEFLDIIEPLRENFHVSCRRFPAMAGRARPSEPAGTCSASPRRSAR